MEGNMFLILTLVSFIFVAVSLLTGKIPASVACAISVVFLWLTGVLNTTEVFENFISRNIITMIGMMILVGALLKTNILINIAGLVRNFKGGGVRILLVAATIIPFILCQFIGGVTAMITVLPLLIALADEVDVSPTLLVLPASVGAQAGLMALPIGSAASMFLMKNSIIANVGGVGELGFWDLSMSRLPGTVVVLLYVIFIGYKLLPQRHLATTDSFDHKNVSLKKSDLPVWKENAIYVLFTSTMLAMCFSKQIGLDLTQIASIAAILTVILGVLSEREAFQSVHWPLIFFMGFMLSLATAIGKSGAGDLLAKSMESIFSSGNLTLAIAGVFIVLVVLTQFMDNMALINIFTPIAVVAATQHGLSPLPFVCAIDGSCLASFGTPLSSPSSLMAYQLGGYSMKEMIIFSAPVILLSSIVSILWIPLYFSIR